MVVVSGGVVRRSFTSTSPSTLGLRPRQPHHITRGGGGPVQTPPQTFNTLEDCTSGYTWSRVVPLAKRSVVATLISGARDAELIVYAASRSSRIREANPDSDRREVTSSHNRSYAPE